MTTRAYTTTTPDHHHTLKTTVRYDDRCHNGHNTLSITADLKDRAGEIIACGQLQDEIRQHLPQLIPLLPFHLCSSDGPLHYIANTIYHAKNKDLLAARHTAIWPDATDEQLSLPPEELTALLEARLPALMEQFHKLLGQFQLEDTA